jgi:hypothetical protein
MLCYDLERRRQNSCNVRLMANRTSWNRTESLLRTLSPEILEEAKQEAAAGVPLTNPAVKELMRVYTHM